MTLGGVERDSRVKFPSKKPSRDGPRTVRPKSVLALGTRSAFVVEPRDASRVDVVGAERPVPLGRTDHGRVDRAEEPLEARLGRDLPRRRPRAEVETRHAREQSRQVGRSL